MDKQYLPSVALIIPIYNAEQDIPKRLSGSNC